MGLRSQRNILSPLCPLSHTLFFSLCCSLLFSPLCPLSLSPSLTVIAIQSLCHDSPTVCQSFSLCVCQSNCLWKSCEEAGTCNPAQSQHSRNIPSFFKPTAQQSCWPQLLLCCASLKKGTVSLQKPVEMWRQSNPQFPMLVGVTMAR